MEKQTLLPSPNDNDNVGKQKKGSKPMLYVAVSTAILLLGLVFYGGEYLGSPCALGVGSTDGDDVIPIGDPCFNSDDAVYNVLSNCAIPPGMDHGVCLWEPGLGHNCQSGQPGATCVDTSDCAIPPGLKHAVCRSSDSRGICQSGHSGSWCGQTSDCVVQNDLDPPHAVCRGNWDAQFKCQR